MRESDPSPSPYRKRPLLAVAICGLLIAALALLHSGPEPVKATELVGTWRLTPESKTLLSRLGSDVPFDPAVTRLEIAGTGQYKLFSYPRLNGTTIPVSEVLELSGEYSVILGSSTYDLRLFFQNAESAGSLIFSIARGKAGLLIRDYIEDPDLGVTVDLELAP